jgi:hypothetical protein
MSASVSASQNDDSKIAREAGESIWFNCVNISIESIWFNCHRVSTVDALTHDRLTNSPE